MLRVCEEQRWNDLELRSRLERIRASFGLDFIGLVDPGGTVVFRATEPYSTGDHKTADLAITKAFNGETVSCVSLFTRAQLMLEGGGLADRAFLELEETPRSRRSPKMEESRGMVMLCAIPVRKGPSVIAVVYGGILLNRNFAMVDGIRDVVFRDDVYKGRQAGTATLFLNDTRIATTVLRENGNRAVGTRVSREVAERVLDNGMAWFGEAFVLKDEYLTAYEPIRDVQDQIIGMLYVGLLKQPFNDIERGIVLKFLYISIFVLLVALVLAFLIAGRLANPIHRLVESSHHMRDGKRPEPVPLSGCCRETDLLTEAFNHMAVALYEREEKLRALNRSYMETLAFVTHELKSPIATMMNYLYLLREQKLGPVTESQMKALRAVDSGGQRLVEMIRHYLNLSRIESGDYTPVRSRVMLQADVMAPLLTSLEAELKANGMCVENTIPATLVLNADLNMVREVYENLLGNAIKYGRPSGRIRLAAQPVNGHVECSVWNDGDGIAPDKLPLLFQKFSRLDNGGAAQRHRGTGLGLFIAQHIVEAHGGWIRVHSSPGDGVTFVFTLPVQRETSVE